MNLIELLKTHGPMTFEDIAGAMDKSVDYGEMTDKLNELVNTEKIEKNQMGDGDVFFSLVTVTA